MALVLMPSLHVVVFILYCFCFSLVCYTSSIVDCSGHDFVFLSNPKKQWTKNGDKMGHAEGGIRSVLTLGLHVPSQRF